MKSAVAVSSLHWYKNVSIGLDCGIPNRPATGDTRIVGGDKADVGEYPWQVKVKKERKKSFISSNFHNL